jgi:hypothetical protein
LKYSAPLALVAALTAVPANAQTTMTAGVVMKNMPAKERFSYIAGIVEGLAQARHARDGKNPKGSGCIYDWFYKEPGMAAKVEAAFRRYPNAMPGEIVRLLAATKCGA